MNYSNLKGNQLLLVFFSLSITAEGIGGPVLKASIRIFLLLILILLTLNKIKFNRIKKDTFIYLIAISIPLIFSVIRGTLLVDLLQYMMYLNCIIFCYLYILLNGKLTINDLLLISLPFVLIFFSGGLILNEPIFWRETYSDNAIRLGGRIINPNELGMLASIASLILIKQFLSSKSLIKIALLFFSLVVLIYTESRSSFLALFVGLVFLMNNKIRIILSSILLVFILTKIELLLLLIPRSDMTTDLVSFTGRAFTWQVAFTKLLPEYWLIGAGFQQFPGANYGAAKMAHNTFIQQMIGGGIIGLSFAIYLVFRIWKKLNKIFKAILIIVLINSLTEFGFFGLFNHAVMLFCLFTITRNETDYIPSNSI